MTYILDNNQIHLMVHLKDDGMLHLEGKVHNTGKYKEMIIMAPNPIDKMMNYSGSGLPFTCPTIAFDNTPNYFIVKNDGKIECIFTYPNSYYTIESQQRIVPSIFVTLKTENEPLYYQIKLEDNLPLKTSTTYRSGFKSGPDFYAKKETIMGIPPNQEWILRNIGDYKAKFNLS